MKKLEMPAEDREALMEALKGDHIERRRPVNRPSTRNRYNAYVCPNGHTHYTMDAHDGTTPFMMACLTCGETAESQFYRVNPIIAATRFEHVWINPTNEQLEAYIETGLEEHSIVEPDEVLVYGEQIREHVAKGGLILVEKVETDEYKRTNGWTQERKTRKVGRNEPCPCGSGKKYKKCHGFGR